MLVRVSNKGYEVALRWDDKINDNLSYWIEGIIPIIKMNLKVLKTLLFPINGVR
jgi:hypothetical protein